MVIRDWLLHWITTKHGRKSFSRPPKDVWNLKGKCLDFLPRNEGVYFVTFNLLNGCQELKKSDVFFRWQAITEYGLRGQWREAVSILSDPWDPKQLGKNGRTRVHGAVRYPTHHWTTGRKNPSILSEVFLGMVPKKGVGWSYFLKVGAFLRMVKGVFMGEVLQWMSWIV